jgi:type IV pilus assembly protein PilA
MNASPYRQRLVLQVLSKTSQIKTNASKGFTLVELLIVVIILAVLAAIAIPAFLNQQGRARVSAAQTAAMDAARACAALAVTADQSSYVLPTGVTGTCNAAGTASTFTSVAGAFGTTTQAVGTVAASGATNLTACAAAPGWTVGTTDAGCQPVKV